VKAKRIFYLDGLVYPRDGCSHLRACGGSSFVSESRLLLRGSIRLKRKYQKMAVFEKNPLSCQRSRKFSRSFQTFSLISFLERVPRQPWSTFHSELMVFIFYSRLVLCYELCCARSVKSRSDILDQQSLLKNICFIQTKLYSEGKGLSWLCHGRELSQCATEYPSFTSQILALKKIV